ncbi:unnamed protein product [Chondrus crispus]|uniref:Uncharacterized protein n=1 Tax=Chondrus crispus TaxID=2769 RepID=R7QL68_CHOCR|nr:unnamed protein product [Chondrus crispus]CDF38483.1 unnamed protein product [Chondrus crispus]|eukprot:XP_005718376.1 unnamed protein product [Chondrus crispus]
MFLEMKGNGVPLGPELSDALRQTSSRRTVCVLRSHFVSKPGKEARQIRLRCNVVSLISSKSKYCVQFTKHSDSLLRYD